MLDIKNIEGKVVFSTPINKGCKRKYTLMQEDYISLVFSVEEPIYFRLGDSIYDGQFEITDLVSPKYNDSTAGYDYEVRFDKYYWKWKNKKFFYTEKAREASWSLTANLYTQLSIVIKNLEFLNYRYKGKAFEFSVDSTVEKISKPLRYDNLNIIEALNLMAQTWECEWWVTDNIIHFGRCEYGTAVDFRLNDNVEKMSKSEGKQTFATRVYAFGSERNITKNYRPTDSMTVNGVVQKRLMLPVGTPFIDAYEGMTNEEAVEQVVIFDEVYPKLISKVSKVESKEGKDEVGKIWTYFISDDSLEFDKKYILPDTELRLVFQSGKLNGLDFALSFADNKFEIIRNEDYGRLLPDDILKPEIGDEFILHGYDTTFVSDALLPKAEQELKEKAIQFVEKSKIDPATYECSMMSDYMLNEGNVRTFEVGDRVRLINKAYFKDSRVSRIIGYEYPLDMPYDSPIYIVGETASYSHLEEIKAEVKELTYKEKTFSGSGSNVYVIGQYDSTKPTDRNVLSSLRALNTFLRKDQADSTEHLITFLAGLKLGEKYSIDENGDAELRTLLLTPDALEDLSESGITQGITELTEDKEPEISSRMSRSLSPSINQRITEVSASSSGIKTLGDLQNVDETFDTVPDAVYSFRKQDGKYYPILGGGSTSARLVLTYITPAAVTVVHSMPFVIEYMFSSLIDGEETGAGSVTYRVNNRIVGGTTINQGTNTFDVSRHLILGDSTVIISVTDSYGNTRTLNYRITAVNVQLTSTFNANQIFNSIIPFRFTPFGFGQMVIHILVDGEQIGEVMTSTSNRQQNYNIPKQTHGAHIIEAYMTIDIDGDIITSNRLRYSVISIEQGNNDTIISSPFVSEEMEQFDTVLIPFTVYNPLLANQEIEMLVNGRLEQTRIVDRTQQHWSYNLTESGEVTLQIKAGSVTKSFVIDVAESSIADLEETEAMQLKLISAGRSSSESDRDKWEYGNIKSKFTGFNWTSNGWAIDDNGSSYLKVSGDAKLDIPFKIFDTDFKLNGKTIEVVFFTEDVSNLNYVVLSCMQGGKGFEITSQSVIFKSEQSSITTQFKENELIRISISVEQSAKNRLISLFINGILSGVVQYPISDNFIQANPVNITAQGLEATIGIYAVRVYNTDLQAWQVLNNYIFDYPVASERNSIYIKNNILGVDGAISYERLVEQLPCVTIIGDLPQFKGDKKTCRVEFEDRQTPGRSFTATNVQNDVQGTSSQYYPRKNYKMKFRNGFDMSDGSHKDGFETHDTTLPAVVFTHKADFAEASGTHNTGLAKVIENLLRTLDIKTPPQLIDEKVRTTIDGFASAIFHKQNEGDTPVFIGKYNFNTDKAAENTFGFKAPVECWEVQNNTSRRVLFKESDYVGDDWLNDFESRFPEDNEDYTNLKRMTDWVVSCIGNPTKFRNEFEQYFHKDFMLSYYVITELFAMVDQRAKNCFWTSFDTKIWLPIFYDNDTALGINNEGVNAFYFDVETHDKIGTQDVWNGADSELWKLLEQAFPSELEAMYQRIRKDDTLSYNSVLNVLNGEHSDKWSETVYNEDGLFKYIDPLINDGNGSYLYAAQGSREEHRKWWLYNRFRYMDSKYNTGDFKSDYITMRLYTPSGTLAVPADADFEVTTFGSQYIRAKWGSYESSKKVKLGESVLFEAPDITFNDTETILYGASYLKSIGDLSGKYAGTVDVSKATQLTELMIGSSVQGYVNTNLHVLNVGNNKLLKKINIENCPNLTQAVDLSNCISIEEVYAKGSNITSVGLPNGGSVKTLSLPNSLLNLTIIGHPIRIDGLLLEGYDTISTVRLERNPNLDSYSLVKSIMSDTLQNIRLIDIDATDVNIDTLIAMSKKRGIDENGFTTDTAVITGKIHVGKADSYELAILNQKLPYLTITYDELVVTPMRIFTITNASNGMPFEELDVYINDELYHPDESGKIEIRSGSALTVLIEKEGYKTFNQTYPSTASEISNYEIKLYNYVRVSVTVKSTKGDLIQGIIVTMDGVTATTNVLGIAVLNNVIAGIHKTDYNYNGKIYSENVTVGYIDMSHTYNGIIIPTRTVIVRSAASSSSRLAGIEVKVGYDYYTTDSNGSFIVKDSSQVSATVVETDSYKGITVTLPSFTTATKTDYIDLIPFVLGEVKVVGKNGFNLNGASVTLQSKTAVTSGGIASFTKLYYQTSVQLKVTYESEVHTENVNIGYTDFSKTITLNVDEIESMKPVPNGNPQMMVTTSRVKEIRMLVRGLEGQNAQIDWGDGSPLELINNNTMSHTYADVGLFNIEIKNATNLTLANVGGVRSSGVDAQELVAYWTIGDTNIQNVLTYDSTLGYGDTSRKTLSYVGDDVFKNDSNRTDWSHIFHYSKISNIPTSFKQNNKKATTFQSCFQNCTSLTTIPQGLFDDCTAVTSFNSCFDNCHSLTTIPSGLFDNCTAVTDFYGCFYYCISLVYCEIPQFRINADKRWYVSGATLLSYLKSNSTTPPIITTTTIPNNTNLKIYVPDASVDAYKTATNWSAYASKIYPLSEYEN